MDDRRPHPPDERSKGFFARHHAHPGEDRFATLPISQTVVQSVQGTDRCHVCARFKIGMHYGASVCGSCASFFRRTIGNGKAYQCTCRMPFRNKKKGCRHCRFNNCLKAGMDARVVQAIKSFPQSNDSLLSRLLACRGRLYISRGLLLREMDAQRAENSRWRSPDLGRGRSFEYLCNVEFRGLTQYWTDFLQCSPHFRDGASPTLLTKHFLAIWLKLEQVLATVSHGRIDMEACLSDYETTIPATYDWLYAFCCRYVTKWSSDPAVLAALALENVSELLYISRIVRRASLDNLEVTALLQFLVAYYEREMFVDHASLQRFLNQVLGELHDHYKSTYHSYHERLGVIVSIVCEFHRVMSLNKQFCMQISLYTKSGMQFPSQAEPVNTVHDLRHSVKM